MSPSPQLTPAIYKRSPGLPGEQRPILLPEPPPPNRTGLSGLASQVKLNVTPGQPIMVQERAPDPSGTSAIQPSPISIQRAVTKIVERQKHYWTFSWHVLLINSSTEDAVCNLKLQWLDKQGFALEELRDYGVVVPAGEDVELTGTRMLSAAVGVRVASIRGTIVR
jgi:hypothetical protein